MAEEEGRKFGWWWSPFRGAQVFYLEIYLHLYLYFCLCLHLFLWGYIQSTAASSSLQSLFTNQLLTREHPPGPLFVFIFAMVDLINFCKFLSGLHPPRPSDGSGCLHYQSLCNIWPHVAFCKYFSDQFDNHKKYIFTFFQPF